MMIELQVVYGRIHLTITEENIVKEALSSFSLFMTVLKCSIVNMLEV